ncbi:TM2 domain-containing protein [Alteromonas sp. a30]|uniref:TM2 domain-containing protein n=1 Tax=Alteromonas sp. a30 TaxID=2730917 RepID=UPI00227E804A|nr:TM2 domain-containing protein [Alteromonas sp. a30]MCY7296272.1 TM2 domain-containing protein [Alteromonas sp. a30]
MSNKVKNKNVAATIALLAGGFGIHKFYLGQTLWGWIYLVFFWTFIPSVVALVEFILYLFMSEEEFDAKYNKPIQVEKAI